MQKGANSDDAGTPAPRNPGRTGPVVACDQLASHSAPAVVARIREILPKALGVFSKLSFVAIDCGSVAVSCWL